MGPASGPSRVHTPLCRGGGGGRKQRGSGPGSCQGLQRLLWPSPAVGAARLLRWWGKVGMSSGSQAAGRGRQQWAGPLGPPLGFPLLPSHDPVDSVCPGPPAHLDGPALSSPQHTPGARGPCPNTPTLDQKAIRQEPCRAGPRGLGDSRRGFSLK